jgi:hypothetical protein
MFCFWSRSEKKKIALVPVQDTTHCNVPTWGARRVALPPRDCLTKMGSLTPTHGRTIHSHTSGSRETNGQDRLQGRLRSDRACGGAPLSTGNGGSLAFTFGALERTRELARTPCLGSKMRKVIRRAGTDLPIFHRVMVQKGKMPLKRPKWR